MKKEHWSYGGAAGVPCSERLVSLLRSSRGRDEGVRGANPEGLEGPLLLAERPRLLNEVSDAVRRTLFLSKGEVPLIVFSAFLPFALGDVAVRDGRISRASSRTRTAGSF